MILKWTTTTTAQPATLGGVARRGRPYRVGGAPFTAGAGTIQARCLDMRKERARMYYLALFGFFAAVATAFLVGEYVGKESEKLAQRRRREWQHRLDRERGK